MKLQTNFSLNDKTLMLLNRDFICINSVLNTCSKAAKLQMMTINVFSVGCLKKAMQKATEECKVNYT